MDCLVRKSRALSFYDTAWAIATMVSRKSFEEIKLLLDERVPYPHIDYIGRPVKEYFLHVPLPEKLVPYDLRENHLIAWRVFKACVGHEAGHAYLTDPFIYEEWKCEKDLKTASFVANLLEDFRVENFLSSKWAGLRVDLALANAVAYLRSRSIDELVDPLKRIMMAAASHAFVKHVKGKMTERETKTIHGVSEILKNVKWVSQPQILIPAANKIYEKIIKYDPSENLRAYPVAPHHDGNPSNEFYRNNVLDPEGDAQKAIQKTMTELSQKDLSGKVFNNDTLSEVSYFFHREETFRQKEQRILRIYQKNKYNLLSIGFPKSDYSEYLRIRKKVFALTRRILGVLAQVKSDYEEESYQRSGMVDLMEAIQAVASETRRSDVFMQQQRIAASSAWAVLVDSSESLSATKGMLKEIAICLAEIANSLMDTSSWALYSFSDSLSILKDFNDKYDKRVCYRLGGLTTGGLTYLPDALKIVSKRLLIVPQVYKVLIVITDGRPHGYEGIEEEAKNEVKNVERSGITLIAIGLKNKEVGGYFNNFCYVDDVGELAKSFTRLYYALSQW